MNVADQSNPEGHMKRIAALILSLLLGTAFLTACSGGQACYQVQRPNGQYVYLQECKPIVAYQGTNFSIKRTNIPIPATGLTVNLGDTAWNKILLQTAASASQIMDIQRVSRCERLSVLATTMTNQAEYERLLKNMYESEEKLNQLTLLIAMNNPAAVVNWVNAYSKEIAPGEVTRALNDPDLAKAESTIRSMNHQVYMPKDTKVRSLDSLF